MKRIRHFLADTDPHALSLAPALLGMMLALMFIPIADSRLGGTKSPEAYCLVMAVVFLLWSASFWVLAMKQELPKVHMPRRHDPVGLAWIGVYTCLVIAAALLVQAGWEWLV